MQVTQAIVRERELLMRFHVCGIVTAIFLISIGTEMYLTEHGLTHPYFAETDITTFSAEVFHSVQGQFAKVPGILASTGDER